MKRVLLYGALLASLSACQKDNDATPELAPTETADWYVLRAPDDRAIEAVAGDIDGTLVITTRYQIYYTQDRGKTWQQSKYSSNIGLFGFSQQQDTLLTLNGGANSATNTQIQFAFGAAHYSVDQGITWQVYRNWRREYTEPRVPLNKVASPSGTLYSIEYLLTPTSPNSSSSYIESIGITSAAGQKLVLPQDHQINSISFDTKSRLYVTASAPLCGQRENFKYCEKSNGTLYVSKKPQL
ncbi:hypothetical protein MUN82_20300 [Hymenobacter aerilatus]|uniref:Uncharacterized protein n=1 Tax=Hymenobacter aerilatus TaxID=2932251 RepID=A0A8T9SV57_9BACT|nr:hypothetical protein [Hymenobacter aerilatus]UOR05261.1 hypothetical protein MUN82_20300 [Hymenobacter aerilatus]